MTTPPKPLVLLILDGFGYREETKDNAIAAAHTPVWDQLWRDNPRSLVSGSGLDVGLPEGQFGNSEVGHMTLGAGRVVWQQLTRIDKDIADGTFFENPAYCAAIDKAIANNKAVHIWGLLSDGGVHSHENHILAALQLAVQRGAENVYLHAFLDGRDTPPRSAEDSLRITQDTLDALGTGRIATLCGRYYAMDRDKRWDRVEKAYNLLTDGHEEFHAATAIEGLHAAYARDENDEFVKPTVIGKPVSLQDGDAVLFMNFRADRARQITRAFTNPAFDGFVRQRTPALSTFVMTSEYADDIAALCAYPPSTLKNSLGEYLAGLGKTQLRIAETKNTRMSLSFSAVGAKPCTKAKHAFLSIHPKSPLTICSRR
jgi:2,3-bisphosphoglycerate-independent phosphoglycerate mutase